MIAVLDIGGTSIKYGVLDSGAASLSFLEEGEKDSDAKLLGGEGLLRRAEETIHTLCDRFAIQGIAVSTAGMVDAQKGCILYANENIPGYTGMKIKQRLESVFRRPCWVENDVNAAALGEYTYGCGTGTHSLLMLTIGTGIGGALVLQGQVYPGFSNSAGEIGYMWIGDGEFQDIASTTALVKNVEQRKNQSSMNGKMIFAQAMEGDRICKEEIRNMCESLAKGIHNCACLLNPEMVVLGGGIMAQREYLTPVLDQCLNRYMKEQMRKNTRVEFASLGNKAGMAGAFAYFLKKESRE